MSKTFVHLPSTSFFGLMRLHGAVLVTLLLEQNCYPSGFAVVYNLTNTRRKIQITNHLRPLGYICCSVLICASPRSTLLPKTPPIYTICCT
jgi:hypothetical protein